MRFADMPTLVQVVQGLKGIVNGFPPQPSLTTAVRSSTRETHTFVCPRGLQIHSNHDSREVNTLA
jgi:hypothetical protein